MEFEWDVAKEKINLGKHGVDFSTVPQAFEDCSRVFIRYPGMARNEVRWQLIGFDGHGILTVRFTLRAGVIRVIGAGYWRKQKEIYESQS